MKYGEELSNFDYGTLAHELLAFILSNKAPDATHFKLVYTGIDHVVEYYKVHESNVQLWQKGKWVEANNTTGLISLEVYG